MLIFEQKQMARWPLNVWRAARGSRRQASAIIPLKPGSLSHVSSHLKKKLLKPSHQQLAICSAWLLCSSGQHSTGWKTRSQPADSVTWKFLSMVSFLWPCPTPSSSVASWCSPNWAKAFILTSSPRLVSLAELVGLGLWQQILHLAGLYAVFLNPQCIMSFPPSFLGLETACQKF